MAAYQVITFESNGGLLMSSNDLENAANRALTRVEIEYEVGKTYASQGGLAPDSFRIATADGAYYRSRRWGGRNGRSWDDHPEQAEVHPMRAYGLDFGRLADRHPSPWMTLADNCFKGWWTQPVGGVQVLESDVCNLDRDITLYAHWDFTSARFVFDAQGGTFDGGASTVEVGFDLLYLAPYARLPVPVRPGFLFQGWFTLPKDFTLDDQCRALGYTAVGDMSDEDRDWFFSSEQDRKMLEDYFAEPRGGRKVQAADFYRCDAEVSDWLPLNDEPGSMFVTIDDVESMNPQRCNVAANRLHWHWWDTYNPGSLLAVPRLYAHWTSAGTLRLTLDDCGGLGGAGTVAVGAGGSLPAVVPPTLAGRVFLGYFRYPNGGGLKYYNADGTAAAVWGDACDGTIFAAWSEARVARTVALYETRDGYSATTLGRSVTVYDGEPYGELPAAPVETGFSFSHWAVSATTSPADAVRVKPSMIVQIPGNHYMIAFMTRDRYGISYQTFGAGVPASAPTSYDYGVRAVYLPTASQMNGLAPEGMSFAGWYEAADFSGSAVLYIPRTGTGDRLFWAKWEAKSVTVQLNANGGSVSPSSLVRTYGQPYGELPVPVRSGYDFVHWQGADGGMVISNTLVALATAHTLAAQWTEASPSASVPSGYVKYKINLVLNGGEIAASYGALKYVARYAKALPTAAQVTKSGATFGGWYADAGFSGSPVTSIPSTSTGRVTYYARWL
jgi:uncharacterized repeat protein (TIGR02543 family)